MRMAVVGHVEWVTFVRVEHLPSVGEIVHASQWWDVPAGGGAAAAVQLTRLANGAKFYTALGDDDLGRRAMHELTQFGVRVHAVFRPTASRRALTHVDADGERTITVMGDRLPPHGYDPLPWDALDGTDGVYFTAGDEAALRHARRARVLVATPRAGRVLRDAGVELDALVASALDASEAYSAGDIDPTPRLIVRTEGKRGGSIEFPDGRVERFDAPPLPGPIVDRYGAGDAFAACLSLGLARGDDPSAAVALAARCGAAVITGRGPYEGQLTTTD
jgi:ribokinase